MSAQAIAGRDPRVSGQLMEPSEPERRPSLIVFVHGGGCNGYYFDLKGFSSAQAALRRGHSVLLVDRPGHGGSAAPISESPIVEAAELLMDFIGIARQCIGATKVALIGHSIGGAVAVEVAARRPGWPLSSIAVSGIGDALTAASRHWLNEVLAGAAPEPPTDFFFGPEGSYGWQGPAALRRSGEPWRLDEVIEVMRDWPTRFAAVAGAVRVPVHFRSAEFERIWDHSDAALSRITAAFRDADMGLLPDGGHLYEVHKRGPELIAAQLNFIERAALA